MDTATALCSAFASGSPAWEGVSVHAGEGGGAGVTIIWMGFAGFGEQSCAIDCRRKISAGLSGIMLGYYMLHMIENLKIVPYLLAKFLPLAPKPYYIGKFV